MLPVGAAAFAAAEAAAAWGKGEGAARFLLRLLLLPLVFLGLFRARPRSGSAPSPDSSALSCGLYGSRFFCGGGRVPWEVLWREGREGSARADALLKQRMTTF